MSRPGRGVRSTAADHGCTYRVLDGSTNPIGGCPTGRQGWSDGRERYPGERKLDLVSSHVECFSNAAKRFAELAAEAFRLLRELWWVLASHEVPAMVDGKECGVGRMVRAPLDDPRCCVHR